MRQKAEHSMDPNGADPLAKTKFADRHTTLFINCYLSSHHSRTNMTSSLHNQAFSVFPPLLVLSPILFFVVSNCRSSVWSSSETVGTNADPHPAIAWMSCRLILEDVNKLLLAGRDSHIICTPWSRILLAAYLSCTLWCYLLLKFLKASELVINFILL